MKKFAIILALGASMFLAGCQHDEIQMYKTQYQAIVPPDTFYECPKRPPRPTAPEGKIRDSQVAEYIVRLNQAHAVCSRSLEAIREFARQAKLTVETNSQ
jgi:hypothetical protein